MRTAYQAAACADRYLSEYPQLYLGFAAMTPSSGLLAVA
jgi:hypothetical protein